MSNRISPKLTGLLVLVVVALACQQARAIYYALAPSSDDWGLKYEVAVEDAGSDKLLVKFTLAGEGRLKPIHSVTVAVLDKQRSTKNSRLYDVRGKLELKPTADGKRRGQLQIRKDQSDDAIIRVLTQRVDGKFQSAGAAYYDIPLAKFLREGSSPEVASQPESPADKVK